MYITFFGQILKGSGGWCILVHRFFIKMFVKHFKQKATDIETMSVALFKISASADGFFPMSPSFVFLSSLHISSSTLTIEVDKVTLTPLPTLSVAPTHAAATYTAAAHCHLVSPLLPFTFD